MTRGSKLHREDLDGLFDRIQLDTSISVRYVNTPQQIADILTKSSCTTLIWSQLLHMFGLISHDTCAHCQLFVAPHFVTFLLMICQSAWETISQRSNLSAPKESRDGQLLRSRPRSDCKVLWESKLIKLLRKPQKKFTKSEPTVV